MHNDLFQLRMMVGIADWVNSRNVLTEDKNAWSSAMMAINGQRDLSGSMLTNFKAGVEDRSALHLLRAFWGHYSGEIELYEAESRLFVNPPAQLAPNAGWVATINSQPFLTGTYGKSVHAGRLDIDVPAQIEDITIFLGIPPEKDLLQRIAPESTVTLIMPSRLHHFWTTWAGLDLGVDDFMQAVAKQWTLKEVYHVPDKNASVEVFGVEP